MNVQPRPEDAAQGLCCCTRGNADPHEKPRVFFASHPDDSDRYFGQVVEMLHRYQNCAVYYQKEDGDKRDSMSFDDLAPFLSQMQLVVVPVTTRLVTLPNLAMDEIVPYAIHHHIPVLPLMMESGLDDMFRERFGDLQYLQPGQTDPTALPFDLKLEKYLSGVLVGDEMAARVRDAFDAYIFLSYRKKDRAYAQELMRMIHKSNRYRDIAIWYDEYLVPGENFNQAIQAALAKGKLFALVVTPSLLEKDNYVMFHEYPAARESGKPVLAAQMTETDKEKLSSFYEAIPDCVNVHDAASWEQAMTRYFRELAVTKSEGNPQHTFLIGLAYLDGIDVEVDALKAKELITDAADMGLPQAMEKLAAMYHEGKGVERDYRVSASWREKLAEALKDAWEKKGELSDLKDLVSVLWDLGDAYWELQDLEAAFRAYQQMLSAAEAQREAGDPEGSRNLSVSCNKLGDVEQARGNLIEARRNHEKALAISEALFSGTPTAQLHRDLLVGRNKLGDIEQALGNLEEAKKNYEKAFAISEELADKTHSEESRRDLSVSCHKLGSVEQALENPEGAKAYYEKALAISEKLAEETQTVQSRRDLSVVYNRLGDIAKDRGNLDEARRNYLEALQISEKLSDETQTVQAQRDLSISYYRLGDIGQGVGNPEEARRNYEKALEITRRLAADTRTAQAQRDLAVSYHKAGLLEYSLGNLAGAKVLFEKALAINENLAAGNETDQTLRDLSVSCAQMGDVEQSLGNLEAAKRYYKKDLEISGKIAANITTPQSRRDLMVSHHKAGDIEIALGNPEEAKRHYEKALQISEELAAQTQTVLSQRDLSISCIKLGDVGQALRNPEEAKKYYRKAMEIRKRLAAETRTIGAFDDLAVSYFKAGTLEGEEGQASMQKAYELWDQLAKACPSMPQFAQRRDIAAQFCQVL